MVNHQRDIEGRFLRIVQEPVAMDRPMEAVFGPMEDWLLHLGPHQLVLMPPSGEWALLDPRHQSWEHTGLGTGEVDFSLQGTRLVINRRPGAPPLRADLGDDRWYLRSGAGTVGPKSREEIVRELRAGHVVGTAAVRRVGTPVWLRADALYRPAGTVERGVATLQVMAGVEVGRQLVLADRNLLGSGAGSTLTIADSLVGAVQTEILHVGGDSWQIRDVGGHGGTRRNGIGLEGWESLNPGDEVGIGRTLLLFHQLKELG